MFSGECKSPGNQWSGPAEANVCCWLVSHGFHFLNFREIFLCIVSFAGTFMRSLALLSFLYLCPKSQPSVCRLQCGTFIVCRTDVDVGGAVLSFTASNCLFILFYCFLNRNLQIRQ